MPVRQTLSQSVQLDLDNFLQMLLRERVEDNGLVHPVQKLRPEMASQLIEHRVLHPVVAFARETAPILQDPMTPDIGRHDHDGVLEIHRTPLPIRKTAIVQYLQQYVEHVRVGFFDFVEKDYTVWTTSNRLR